ncbi:hypothetical protein NQ318_017292 [Aromia moschata]|uniref:MIT domain-containing protein n=1 Tax=Aromia moschata TaxID=1265417 RepID=A0AAV8XWU2_9CUCU|nr:hypothetical protein NQ318_017292 [Aromia moschata]
MCQVKFIGFIEVQFDQDGETNIAAYYYEAAKCASLLEQAALVYDPGKTDSLREKATEYKNRAHDLQKKVPEENKIVESDSNKAKLKRCYFLLQQAIDEDEQGDKQDAIELYTQAIEYITQYPDLMQGIRKRELPLQPSTPLSNPFNTYVSPDYTNQYCPAKTDNSRVIPRQKPGLHRGTSAHLQVSGQDTYTEEEKLVLLHTSKINRRDYVPFYE